MSWHCRVVVLGRLAGCWLLITGAWVLGVGVWLGFSKTLEGVVLLDSWACGLRCFLCFSASGLSVLRTSGLFLHIHALLALLASPIFYSVCPVVAE